MTFLARLNPANRLFGRIFLWFWVATLLMIFSSLWLAKQLSRDFEIQPLNTEEVRRLNSIADRIQRLATRNEGESLSLLLGKVGHRGRLLLMLVEPEGQHFVYGFPGPMRPRKEPFKSLLGQPTPLLVKTGGTEFTGPATVLIKDRTYRLFVGKPIAGGPINRLRQQHPGFMLLVALTVSAALCGALTWSILKPIRQLREAAHEMSKGDLQARADAVSSRGDEIGQLGKDFNLMGERLMSLLDSQRRLLADVSHELRSPLARLQVAIGITQQRMADKPQSELSESIARIEKEAHEIERMIEQVLRLSRLETKPNIEEVPIALESLLGERIEDARYEAKAQDKSVSFTCESHYTVSGDPALLASAFDNLIRNAVKYASTKVQVSVEQKLSNLIVSVSDDGPGVSKADRHKIFEPFYRVSLSRDRSAGGVGLGLAIAKRAILTHRGNIEASCSDMSGLTVRVTLPAVGQVRE